VRFKEYVQLLVLLASVPFPASSAAASVPPPKGSSHRLLMLVPPRPAGKPVRVKRLIVVNKANNTLKLYRTGHPVLKFPVATGLYRCTPEGRFKIIQRSVLSRTGRGGPMGTRWLGLNTLGRRGWYRVGIHGTNDPRSIGKYASKACVRMFNADVDRLYEMAPLGTSVRIINIPEKSAAIQAKSRSLLLRGVPQKPTHKTMRLTKPIAHPPTAFLLAPLPKLVVLGREIAQARRMRQAVRVKVSNRTG
jgi:hypothetical protein